MEMENEMIDYLQGMMDRFQEDLLRYGMEDEVVQKELDDMIACKEMAEAIIGLPVNLQKNGLVTVGFQE